MAGVLVWRCALGPACGGRTAAAATWTTMAAAASVAAVRPCRAEPLAGRAQGVVRCSRPLTTSAAVRTHAGPERGRDGQDADPGPPATALDGPEQQRRAQTNQVRRPWHREGADQPPAAKGSGHPTKGKILTTPNRLFKIVLPLPLGTVDEEGPEAVARMEPLSFFVHPQQPISYVQRLIQAELPPVVDAAGRERPPDVAFWAEDAGSNHDAGRTSLDDSSSSSSSSRRKTGSHVATYAGGLGHEGAERADADKDWVRWGSSTEMGDFIREAARGREFAIRIEGGARAGAGRTSGRTETRVSVPSFADRTYYQRLRLRRLSAQIEQQAAIKRECDALAHRGARRLALGGFAGMLAWWAAVYYVTYRTDYGWDLMEPVTYLAGLAAIMGGYLWFLFISRDLSYKAAMKVTVSRQRVALYESRGFDVRRWERLVDEANALRTEIRRVAYEYDVDWDEAENVGGDRVKKVLEKEEKLNKAEDKAKAEDEEEEEEEEEEGEAEEDAKKGAAVDKKDKKR